MRARGLTLLEVAFTVALLAVLLSVAFGLLDTTTKVYSDESVRQAIQTQVERIVATVADDYAHSAAWQCFAITNAGPGAPGSGAGDTVQRLTKFYESSKKVRGVVPDDGTAPFAWAPVRSDLGGAVAFLRGRGHAVHAFTAGFPAYLVLDFEPLGLGAVPASGDVDGDGAITRDNQPGRQNDDQRRQFVLYRTRAVDGRIAVERVLGLAAITNDGSDTGTAGTTTGLDVATQSVIQIGDLGPAPPRLPAGSPPGRIEVEAFDTASATGAGIVRIRAVARGLVLKGNSIEVVTADLETQVAPTCALPPF